MTILFLGTTLALSKNDLGKAEATHGFVICNGRTDCHRVDVAFCNRNTGTNWQTHYSLINDSGTYLGWLNPWLNSADGASPCGTYNGYYRNAGFINNSNRIKLQWWTSCVDPIISGTQYGTGGVEFFIDVTCKQGVGGIYWMCDYGSPNNLGSVNWNEQCPLTIPPPPPSVSKKASASTRQPCAANWCWPATRTSPRWRRPANTACAAA